MQNSGILKVLTIILVLVCVYELTFTFKTKSVESDAKAKAGNSAEKYRSAIKAKESEVVLNLLGAEYTYKECKEREINLGLDLRGGVSVTVEIALENLVRQMAGANAQTPDFQMAIAQANEIKKSSADNYVDIFYSAYQDLTRAGKIKQSFVSLFKNQDNTKELRDDATDKDAVTYLEGYADKAIDESFRVLRTRVVQFGIAQPSIKRVGKSGRIMVDLPGVEDIERVRRVLQGSANLEFWDTYSIKDLEVNIEEADKEAYAYEQLYGEVKKKEVVADTAKKDNVLGALVSQNKSVKPDTTKMVEKDSTAEAKEDDMSKKPLLAKLRGFSNSNFAVLLADTPKVNLYFNLAKAKGILPPNIMLGWGSEIISDDKKVQFATTYFLRGERGSAIGGLSGDVIKYAVAENDPNDGKPVVALTFNATGMKKWADMTQTSFDYQRPIAIVMDGLVFSAPTAHDGPIKEGRTQISGGGGKDGWNHDLATVLNAGRFPAPVKIVEEAYVGPSLGEESIQAGFISFLIALLAVLVFMAFFYGKAGWIANIALLANLFFIMGALAAFPLISLTLPGVAGIVLTVGMSVDANVLIYERIREELRAGKGIKLALNDGYKHAMTAIIDSNFTSLITGIILWYFGSGVIEGFAQTLVIGILTSLFASLFISRIIFDWLLKKDKALTFATKSTENFMQGANYTIIGNRKKAYVLSAIFSVVAILSIATKGFDLGVDFSGGRTYIVRFEKAVDGPQLAEALSKQFVDEKGNALTPEVKQYGEDNQYAITTRYLINEAGDNINQRVEAKLFDGLKPFLPSSMDFSSFTKDEEGKKVGRMNSIAVGAEVADDIKTSAFWSVLLSLIAIFFYVFIRFRKISYSVGALMALFHDILFLLGVFSLLHGVVPFSLEINQAFIAAVLTVLGYSINDTVVVFDRIREYNTLYGNKKSVGDIANTALNSTFGRTINTSMTIFLVLLAIFIFGGESIRGFAFALLIGIIIGTYSSLFIAAPVYVDMAEKEKNAHND
ncbi:MAG: protein translocase subunit SecDF [Flavobacteriales bacterium]